jgi:hypothetical protein
MPRRALNARGPRARGGAMWDLVVIALVVVFFALSLAAVAWGDRLR